MENHNQLINEVQSKGISIKDNWLDKKDINLIENIILKYKPKKGAKNSWVPVDAKSLLIKLLKLDLKAINNSIYFKNLSKKLNLDYLASKIFGEEAYLLSVDYYYNPISNKPVLDWHCDTAYSGAKEVKNLLSPEDYCLKFFFYLTDTSPDNGCLSYIPLSHEISYALKKGLYEGDLKYTPYWSIDQFKATVLIDKNYNYIKNIVGKDTLDLFFENCKKAQLADEKSLFDFSVKKGGAVIFNETGIHKGSKTLLSDRLALRFFYKKKI